MIDLCKTQNLRYNFEAIDPMPPTRFAVDSFDMIYLYSVFSHLSEEAHLAWLSEFKRIMKPGGIVIATTRPRSFIYHCYELSKKTNLEIWQQGAAGSFPDPGEALADYDNGKFVHSPTGGGGVLDRSFYGESCIPKKYVETNWTKLFPHIGFIYVEDHQSFDQDVIYTRK
jgi:ubiquinone/menaquinone biosynthesis C-methylase UbiE